jgi:Baseplate J-like protein
MSELCGCCTGTQVAVPVSERNAPGLSALEYRAGTYATFFETMLARLTRIPQLTTREPSDPSIALLDAFAVVADVLTFYQERIANEGYLPTARERRSVLELARLIGYRLRPGVAASVRLAFTVATGFEGTIPAGTRAQSIPGTGESPQFFETSYAFEARDAWNALAPRLSRIQVVTPAPSDDDLHNASGGAATDPTGAGSIPVTAADLVDTVYVDGLSTGLHPGDALFFVFGNDRGEQTLRLAQSVDLQSTFKRTLVTLALDPRYAHRLLPVFLAKARYLFPGSDIAASVAQILSVLIGNLSQGAIVPTAARAALLRAAVSELALQRQLADARGFSRVSAFIDQIQRSLTAANVDDFVFDAAGAPTFTNNEGSDDGGSVQYAALPVQLAGSPLERLDSIAGALAARPSVQPANALQLRRSVAQSFAPQSDAAPRLIAALKPATADTLYEAWTAVPTPLSRVRVLAARVKATLFASSFAGKATVSQSGTMFAPASISSTWTSLGTPSAPLSYLALDAPYDHIVPGSWVAVNRPAGDPSSGTREILTTFHVVTETRTINMDTDAGFSAKVTVLTVDPPWPITSNELTQEYMLRGTVVYAQAEPLALVQEPLDTDVEGATIDLGDVYAGLEPGRWIIVSGTRTDVPGASGVAASELAMIAAVAQGSESPLCAAFPFAAPPFASVLYTTSADVNGDRLVVGMLAASTKAKLEKQTPSVVDQRYCDQVQLAPGVYANAYVPSKAELAGNYPSFEGMLVDPATNVPFPGGRIPSDKMPSDKRATGLFAWRVSDEKLHTILTLAAPLAYTYDRGSVTIYGNVVDATHGQSTGEVLGNGDATRAFQTFALGQSPLTYVSAPTPSGASSTLTVRVNELEWHELDDLGRAGPAGRVYVTAEDDAQKTRVTFGNAVHGARVPTGTANVKAAYRYGLGKAGNVAAGQISQLATHPLGAQAVVNPLAASGGADPDRIDQARANAPLAVMALDRLVSVRDYADFSRTYAGIGKAAAAQLSDGRRRLVHVTVAGNDDIAIDPSSDLHANLLASLRAFGDPSLPVQVDARRVKLLVMSASVGLLPDYAWESVAPRVRAALLACFAFDARALGQSAFLAEAVRAAQDAEGVAYVTFGVFDGVGEGATAAQLAALGATLALRPFVQAEAARVDPKAARGSARRILPAELVYLTPDVPETLILTEAAS